MKEIKDKFGRRNFIEEDYQGTCKEIRDRKKKDKLKKLIGEKG